MKVDISNNDFYSKELEEYLRNKFLSSAKTPNNRNTYADKEYVETWQSYIDESNKAGALEVLKKCYPQLKFPIEKDIDKTEEYRNFVFKGRTTNAFSNEEIGLNNAEGIEIKLHESIAGKIPVLIIPNDIDFVKIIQSLVHRNNPVQIPDPMGAAVLNGINNWYRLHKLSSAWLKNNPLGNWPQEFTKNIKPYPSLFKDRLIVLSRKPYSNIPAKDLNLLEESWRKYSLEIRLEHECTHLYTLQKFGVMNNNLHDELIADYIGICKALGSFNKSWLLHFMGLENYPVYRKGARLENYVKNSTITGKSFEQLIAIMKNGIENIYEFDQYLGSIKSDIDKQCRIDSLCKISLLEIASENGTKILIEKYHNQSSI